jgi:hypothetical protein
LSTTNNALILWLKTLAVCKEIEIPYLLTVLLSIPLNKLPCPNARGGHDFCFDDLSANHSFYLAFENSNCQDYITEKFWRTLTKPVIPVVMGGTV